METPRYDDAYKRSHDNLQRELDEIEQRIRKNKRKLVIAGALIVGGYLILKHTGKTPPAPKPNVRLLTSRDDLLKLRDIGGYILFENVQGDLGDFGLIGL